MGRILCAVLAATAIVGAAGCGGDSPRDPTSELTAAEIVQRAETAASSLEAFRAAATADIDVEPAPDGLPGLLQNALQDPVTIAGEGPVDGTNASFDFDVTLSGLPPIQANVTKVGRELYVGLLGTDYRVDVPAEPVGAVVPAQLARGLIASVADPSIVGREVVDGVRTVHLRGTLDTDEAVRWLSAAAATLSGEAVPPATTTRMLDQIDAALTIKSVDVWVGTDDLLLQRATVALTLARPLSALPQLRRGTVSLDVRLSDHGKRTTIAAPATSEVLDLDRLRSLAGG